MKTNIVTILFGVNFFVCIGLFRGKSLGQDISNFYIVITLILSVAFGLWLFFIRKNLKQGAGVSKK